METSLHRLDCRICKVEKIKERVVSPLGTGTSSEKST